MTEKMTYVAALNYVLAIELPEDVKEKLTALRDQQIKRNSAERKPTKAQTMNMELAPIVAEILAGADKPMTVSEILRADERLTGLSNQKLTAVIYSMGDEVIKVPDKRVNRFQLA